MFLYEATSILPETLHTAAMWCSILLFSRVISHMYLRLTKPPILFHIKLALHISHMN